MLEKQQNNSWFRATLWRSSAEPMGCPSSQFFFWGRNPHLENNCPLSHSGFVQQPQYKQCGTAPPGAQQAKCSSSGSTHWAYWATEAKCCSQSLSLRLPHPSLGLQPKYRRYGRWNLHITMLSDHTWLTIRVLFYFQLEEEAQRCQCCCLSGSCGHMTTEWDGRCFFLFVCFF